MDLLKISLKENIVYQIKINGGAFSKIYNIENKRIKKKNYICKIT